MRKTELTPDTFEDLVGHLLAMEENKDDIIEQHFPRPSKERNEFKALMERYIYKLDQLIRNSEKSETAENQLPFVAIGSKVEVADLRNHDTFCVSITGPSFEEICGAQGVSYLSPMGLSLLMKHTGDEVVVHAPDGAFHYAVRRIEMESTKRSDAVS